jgi:hypothetical protein
LIGIGDGAVASQVTAPDVAVHLQGDHRFATSSRRAFLPLLRSLLVYFDPIFGYLDLVTGYGNRLPFQDPPSVKRRSDRQSGTANTPIAGYLVHRFSPISSNQTLFGPY